LEVTAVYDKPALGGIGKMIAAAVLTAGVLAIPASAAPSGPSEQQLRMMSQGALVNYYARHPEAAPQQLRTLATALAHRGELEAQPGARASQFPMSGDLFNNDTLGLPQNEESVARCRTNQNLVLSGTNDFRGLLNPSFNFTGWHYSTDGGQSLFKEGLLPGIEFDGFAPVPSQGDPVAAFDSTCALYMADLNVGESDGTFVSAIGLYQTIPETLAGCPGGDDPTCWPGRRFVAVDTTGTHFLDKPWMYVGVSNGQTVVWVTYTDFDFEAGTSTIKGVRCDASLVDCTDPIDISVGDPFTQFSDVTIGPDERTYVTWVEILLGPEGQQTFSIKLRVANSGSTSFGPERVVWNELTPIPFGGFLNANDFRVATQPKSEVKLVGGNPRVFVIWESCQARPLGFACENSRIKLSYSDSFGAGWTQPKVISAGGNNYFSTINSNRGSTNLAVAYWTSRIDTVFTNRQYLELVTLSGAGSVVKRQILTSPGNESEADAFLGGFFIGDYIEVTAQGGVALVAFNANYRKEVLGLDDGIPVPQQDNYLVRATM